MHQSFNQSLSKQQLQFHIEALKGKGYESLEDRADEARKLHDLYDTTSSTWLECKTDYSGFTERLLIEYAANVPLSFVDRFPPRYPIPFSQIVSTLAVLPAKYDALAIDKLDLEPKHLLSYRFAKTDAHYVLDIRALQSLIAERRYDMLVCGYDSEPWRTIASIVPLADVAALAL